MRASRVILVLALLVGVLLITQGLLGIVAPDAFVGVVRFFQTPSLIYTPIRDLHDQSPSSRGRVHFPGEDQVMGDAQS